MFTGLIETTATIQEKKRSGDHIFLTIRPSLPSFLAGVKIGDSINIDGACQTVTQYNESSFTVFTTQATLNLTTFNNLNKGSIVNLEKALQVGGRLDGHFVYGHVEGKGTVKNIKAQGESTLMSLSYPLFLAPFFVKQGSIAVNGVSLTIFDLDPNQASIVLALIPETIKQTNLILLKEGDEVNLETDPIVKYVEHFIKLKIPFQENKDSLKTALIKNGFKS